MFILIHHPSASFTSSAKILNHKDFAARPRRPTSAGPRRPTSAGPRDPAIQRRAPARATRQEGAAPPTLGPAHSGLRGVRPAPGDARCVSCLRQPLLTGRRSLYHRRKFSFIERACLVFSSPYKRSNMPSSCIASSYD